eukprot:gene1700-5893_t
MVRDAMGRKLDDPNTRVEIDGKEAKGLKKGGKIRGYGLARGGKVCSNTDAERRRINREKDFERNQMAGMNKGGKVKGYMKGGKTQGYNDRLDESMGARNDGEDEVVEEAPKKAPKKAEEPVVEVEDDAEE